MSDLASNKQCNQLKYCQMDWLITQHLVFIGGWFIGWHLSSQPKCILLFRSKNSLLQKLYNVQAYQRNVCARVKPFCFSNTPNLKGQRPMQQVPRTTSKPYLNHFESTRALVAQRGATHQKQKVGLSMRGYKTISRIMDSPTQPYKTLASFFVFRNKRF